MKLVVGLGNPGDRYKHNRHNAGAAALDYFAANHHVSGWRTRPALHGWEAKQSDTVFFKPSVYMNDSGRAVQAAAVYYDVPIDDILLVYDELALPFGTVRARSGGESAGHNGVESVINAINSASFHRLRIGIANDHTAQTDDAKFVLSNFAKEEQQQLSVVFDITNRFIKEFMNTDTLKSDTIKAI